MSESAEDTDTGAAAMDIALDQARSDPALAATVENYLNRQIKLSELQEHHMRLRHISDLGRMAFQASLGILALAVVVGAGAMVWNAARSDGYVIESFTVPPDLAERGLTGEVVAARLLDRLQVVQTPSPNSVSAAQAVSTGSSDQVKVEIPETGISLGELYRFLRRWLGHETYISGEVVHQDADVAVAVRVNGRRGANFQGPEASLDSLLQKAAEHVFATIEPVRFGSYLVAQTPRRDTEARAHYQRILADTQASPRDQAGGWNGLALFAARSGDYPQALPLIRRVHQADPTVALGPFNTVVFEMQMSHPEAALALLPQAREVFEKNHDYYSQAAVIGNRNQLHHQDAELRGDYAGALIDTEAAAAALGGERRYLALTAMAVDRARLHDGTAAAWLAQQPRPESIGINRLAFLLRPLQLEAALQHWPQLIAMTAETEKTYEKLPTTSEAGRKYMFAAVLHPWVALAKAKTGDIAAAERLIAPAPADCYDCVRIRGMIASEAKQWDRADSWFARAVQDAPSIPFAHEDWGRSLLTRGAPGPAIEQFDIAHRIGPKFADPLEGWGEALMAQNQSHKALAKFAEAEKYAPKWGRLHLKWGQALAYTGNKPEAAKHFARAATLDLTPAEKSELMRQGS